MYRNQGSRPSSRKRNAKKTKWLSEEALQIAEKRIEAKSKGEKERYIHLNAEFQRIARRDKKAFFSDQCKEIEGNNRMGKTRDLFKKIRDTKGTFHASSVQFSSVAQSCPTLCDSMNCSTPGLPSITNTQSSLRLTSIKLVMPSSHLILCCRLLL